MSQLNKNSQTLESLIKNARELPEALDVDEVATQASLISQIATALEGKAAGIKEIQVATGVCGGGTDVAITGIEFTPSIVFIMYAGASGMGSVRSAYAWFYYGNTKLYARNSSGNIYENTAETTFTVSSGGFRVVTTVEFPGNTAWYAFA